MFLRRLFGSVFIALALLLGQQAAAQHDLKHLNADRHVCDQCFLAAQLSGGVGCDIATIPAVAAGHVDALLPRGGEYLPAPRLHFRSRAPPAFS
jgi:hypothetical protein